MAHHPHILFRLQKLLRKTDPEVHLRIPDHRVQAVTLQTLVPARPLVVHQLWNLVVPIRVLDQQRKVAVHLLVVRPEPQAVIPLRIPAVPLLLVPVLLVLRLPVLAHPGKVHRPDLRRLKSNS